MLNGTIKSLGSVSDMAYVLIEGSLLRNFGISLRDTSFILNYISVRKQQPDIPDCLSLSTSKDGAAVLYNIRDSNLSDQWFLLKE